MADHAEMYSELRARVVDLLSGADGSALDTLAPAAPEWTVRDIVAHMSGVCTDIVNGKLDGVGTDLWTAAQVDARRDWQIARLLDEWDQTGRQVENLIRQIPDLPAWRTFIADAVTHEHDIRGALARPGARDSDAVVYIADSAVALVGERLADAQIGTLSLALDDDAPTTIGAGVVDATLRISRFELVRTITGRRSTSQIDAYDWDGESQPEWLVFGIFTPRSTPLVE